MSCWTESLFVQQPFIHRINGHCFGAPFLCPIPKYPYPEEEVSIYAPIALYFSIIPKPQKSEHCCIGPKVHVPDSALSWKQAPIAPNAHFSENNPNTSTPYS